jgi:predicted dehydrogenase
MIKIGVVDLDTSHPGAFFEILKEMEGVAVTAVCDMGDVNPPGFAEDYARERGIEHVCKTPEEMVALVDAAMVQGCDWDRHLERARPFLEAGKPTFIDKPTFGRLRDGLAIQELLDKHGSKIMCGSSMRWAVEAQELKEKLAEAGEVVLAYATGPGDFFNYGIHTIEMVEGVLGTGIASVRFIGDERRQLFRCAYKDGKQVIMQLGAPWEFHMRVLTADKAFEAKLDTGGVYRALLTRWVHMLKTGEMPAPYRDYMEACCVLIAARRARETERTVYLDDLTMDEGFDGAAFAAEYKHQKWAPRK